MMTFNHVTRTLLVGTVGLLLSACGAKNQSTEQASQSANNYLASAKSEGAAAYDGAVNPPAGTQGQNPAALMCPVISLHFMQFDPALASLLQQHLAQAVTRLRDIIQKVQGLETSNLPPEVATAKDQILAFLNERLSCLNSILSQLPAAANPNSPAVAPTPAPMPIPIPGQGGAPTPPDLIKPPAMPALPVMPDANGMPTTDGSLQNVTSPTFSRPMGG